MKSSTYFKELFFIFIFNDFFITRTLSKLTTTPPIISKGQWTPAIIRAKLIKMAPVIKNQPQRRLKQKTTKARVKKTTLWPEGKEEVEECEIKELIGRTANGLGW